MRQLNRIWKLKLTPRTWWASESTIFQFYCQKKLSSLTSKSLLFYYCWNLESRCKWNQHQVYQLKINFKKITKTITNFPPNSGIYTTFKKLRLRLPPLWLLLLQICIEDLMNQEIILRGLRVRLGPWKQHCKVFQLPSCVSLCRVPCAVHS